MSHYVVYHNEETMGFPATEGSGRPVLSNKPASGEVVGAIVWVVMRQDREYFVAGRIPIDVVEPGEAEGFGDFRRHQGNFSLGLQRITEDEVVEGFEALAASAGAF